MFIYIVGVTKQNPNSTTSTVQARLYKEKPAADDMAPRPVGPGIQSDFNFQVEPSEVGSWIANIGKYAELSAESFA